MLRLKGSLGTGFVFARMIPLVVTEYETLVVYEPWAYLDLFCIYGFHQINQTIEISPFLLSYALVQ